MKHCIRKPTQKQLEAAFKMLDYMSGRNQEEKIMDNQNITNTAAAAFDLTPAAPAELTPAAPAVYDDDSRFIIDLTSRTTSYCSMKATTAAEKADLYNAMNAPANRLKDCINEVIEIKDVFVEVVHCTNTETGERVPVPRTVLIDSKGAGYQAVSSGIFNALKKLFAIFGEPHTWTAPIKVKIKQISKSATNNILTFEIVK
jgi:hypothetical protein